MGGASGRGDKWHHAGNGQRKGRGTRRPPRSPVPPTARIRRLSEAWPCRLSAAPASCAQRLVSRWPCVLSSEPPPGGCHTSPTDVCGANPSGLAARRVARERPRSASHSSCHPRALSPPSTSGARPLSSGVLALSSRSRRRVRRRRRVPSSRRAGVRLPVWRAAGVAAGGGRVHAERPQHRASQGPGGEGAGSSLTPERLQRWRTGRSVAVLPSWPCSRRGRPLRLPSWHLLWTQKREPSAPPQGTARSVGGDGRPRFTLRLSN